VPGEPRAVRPKALGRTTAGLTEEGVGRLKDNLKRVIGTLEAPEFERSLS
jgi:hypothetical protein